MFATKRLAEIALQWFPDHLPENIDNALKCAILDIMGAAGAGRDANSAVATQKLVRKNFASGKSTIWYTGEKTTAAAAALANAAAASALDIDDGNRGAAGHPGASVIPAVFAVAEEVGADTRDALAAIVTGYEVACRIGKARDFDLLPTLSTGRWCAYGVAAATARLRKVSPSILAEAMSIAGAQVPDLAASGYSRVMGNNVKEGIPWATMLGIMAVDMAQEGFTGPLDILDNPDFFDSRQITVVPETRWAIEETYFKRYSSCRWSHAAIDGLIWIMQEKRVDPSLVKRVTVETFERALRLNNYQDPATIEAAQYSIPFCLGIAALRGAAALLPISNESIHSPDIVEFAGRVALVSEENINTLFPGKTPARVIVETCGGNIEKTVLEPWGDPANPPAHGELEAKFRHLTHGFMTEEHQQLVINSVMNIQGKGLSNLIALLGKHT
jgi:2-methylcitrate dehydratase PrpD